MLLCVKEEWPHAPQHAPTCPPHTTLLCLSSCQPPTAPRTRTHPSPHISPRTPSPRPPASPIPSGVFYGQGQATYILTDAWVNDPTIAFRYLLRFDGLSTLLPAGATVLSANLTLNFVNWQPSAVDVLGCYQAKAWQSTTVGPK